jgi:hypothetical protein
MPTAVCDPEAGRFVAQIPLKSADFGRATSFDIPRSFTYSGAVLKAVERRGTRAGLSENPFYFGKITNIA